MRRRIRDLVILAMLGALMFATKFLMQLLPNIHLLALFIGVSTVVYGWRALFSIYIYVFLDGLIYGFSLWWYPYLYIFLPLFLGFLLIPRRLPRRVRAVLYPIVAALHGFLFGILYAPAQAIFFGLDTWEKVIAWIAAGATFDIVHGVSNAVFATLILPMSELMVRLLKRM